MKTIIYTRPDGGLSVCRPSEGARLAFFITLVDGTRLPSGGAPSTARPVDSILRRWPVAGAVAEWAESEDEFVERVRRKDVPPDALNVQIIDEAAIPADRAFRNAWKAGVGCVECDMQKAREIAGNMLRAERAERFKLLDGQWMRAMGRGDTATASAIEAKREKLRNWPADTRIESCGAPDELKAVIAQIKDGG
jgi:hypothetical protein